jgi:hypothetical protein
MKPTANKITNNSQQQQPTATIEATATKQQLTTANSQQSNRS